MRGTSTVVENDPGRAGVEATVERIEARMIRLERTMARLERLADVAEQLPAQAAILVDTADHVLASVQSSGIDLDERARILVRVAERLTAPEALEAVQTLLSKLSSLQTVLDSGLLDPAAVRVVARAGRALAAAADSDPAPVGAWGALRAIGEPEVQRALGFLLYVARDFGKEAEGAPAALPAADRSFT